MKRRAIRAVVACLALGCAMLPGDARAASWSFRTPGQTSRDGKPVDGERAECWLPDGIEYVRGVIVAHPMVANLARGDVFRRVAREESLGTMVYAGVGDIDDLDKVLAQWAGKSGHPELKGAAVLTGGLSASCLPSRIAGFEIPERTFGILNVAGGNLDHPRPESILGVPFQLHVGQFEEFGPEGGIRPHLLSETQWYMLAEDIRARRSREPNALLSMVSVRYGRHGSWNAGLAALFVKEAARLRLPRGERRDGSTPARVIPVKVEDGWLTDGAVTYTSFEPAAYADYKGDKATAQWHISEAVARAVHDYHKKAYGEPGLLKRIWPLGERMPVKLSEQRDVKKDFTAILSWLVERSGRDADDAVIRIIAASLTRQINRINWETAKRRHDFLGLEGVLRQSITEVMNWYGYAVEKYEDAVTAAGLPEAFKALLLRYQMVLSVWTMRNDSESGVLMAMDRPELGIPERVVAGGSAVKLPPGQPLHEELARRWPGFDDASPVSRYLLYRALAAFNPCLRLQGSFCGPSGRANRAETGVDLITRQLLAPLFAIDPALRPGPDTALQIEQVDVPLGDGRTQTFRFAIRPERLLLLPDAETMASLANPLHADLKNVRIRDASMLSGLAATNLDIAGSRVADLAPLAGLKRLQSLRLSATPVSDLTPLKHLALRSLDIANTGVASLGPLNGLPLESLAINGTAVDDLTPLCGMRLRHLDLHDTPVTDLRPLAELPLESVTVSLGTRFRDVDVLKKIPTLKTIDGVAVDAWLKQYRAVHGKPEGEDKLLPMALKRDAAVGPGDWPAKRGPRGTGVGQATGDEWVDDIAYARKAWESEAVLPPTQAARRPRREPHPAPAGVPPVGGLASPVVADGRVYVAYYVPSGPVFAEDMIAEHPAGGRKRWHTDADDVLLCIDAATGRTLWRCRFVEKGYNFNRRPNRENGEMTPCVAAGRVYFLGTRGRVHCVDAKAGEALWSSGMGYRTWDFDYFQWMSHQMQVLLHAKDEFLNPVAAAGDVVGVIDFRSSWYRARYLGNCNLIGLDARTGAPRWITEEVGGFSGTTPLAWTPDGTPDSARLVIGDGREIRCVRPVDGNVVWSVPGGTTTGSTLTRDRLITCRPGGKSLVSYAIGPDEATALDRAGGDEAQVDVSDGSPPAVTDNGLLYTRYSWEEQVVNKDGERVKVTRAGVAVFDIKKGAIVKKSASPIRPADILCAGKQALLMSGGAACVWKSASDRPPRRPFTLPRDRRTSPALAGGRLYLRTRNRIVSYELRERYTRLDADEMKACIAVLKTGTPSRGAEAGLALGNTAADLIPVALANLRDYVKVESGNAFLEGSSAAKKRVRVKDYGRVIAAAEAMARLAAREEAPQAERDATARALGALLEVGTSAQRAEICKAIGAMGGAGKAALPALQDAFANDAVREALREAARSIMEDPDYELTIRVRLPGTGDAGGDGLDLDMGL